MSALITIAIRQEGPSRVVITKDTFVVGITSPGEDSVIKVLTHLIDSANRNLFNGRDEKKEGGPE